MNPAYIAIGFDLVDRLLAWRELDVNAKAEGREVSDEEVDAFIKEYGELRTALEGSVARARAEGR